MAAVFGVKKEIPATRSRAKRGCGEEREERIVDFKPHHYRKLFRIDVMLRASRISAFLSIKYWSTCAIFEYLSDCAAAFGTRNPILITSTIIVLPLAIILIILSLALSLVGALIARYPFAVAVARSLL
jgi:hypothetical protein